MIRTVVVAAAALSLAAPAGADAFAPGAAGRGDPYFPAAGNGGYDVEDYELRFRYRPERRRLSARATISARATEDLSAFNLDYDGPRVRSVRVDGTDARRSRRSRELTVTPAAGIATGDRFVVEIAYRGRPHTITDPDGSKAGWFHTGDGALAVGEPRGSIAWYPVNDHPTDKATYTFHVTVPRRLKAVANGALRGRERNGRWRTFHWRASQPMAPFLATLAIGRFRLDRSPLAGVESVVAVDPREARDARSGLREQGRIIRLFESLFGPYPFTETGAIVDRAGFVGYALETQTRPIYPEAPDDVLIAHEIAHQWFGDSVTLTRWNEIWLNEGFSTWAEWRWQEQTGGPTTARTFAKLLARPAGETRFWNPPPAVPGGPENLFADSIYDRGAMALEALRQRIGDRDFYDTLRNWAAAHFHGHGTIAEFIALAESQSGEQLDDLFETWLYEPGKPGA